MVMAACSTREPVAGLANGSVASSRSSCSSFPSNKLLIDQSVEGIVSPGAKLDVNGNGIFRGALQLPATGAANSTTKGFNSQPFDYFTSVYNGSAVTNQHFRWQAEPVNPGVSTASGKLNLLFASGTATPAETGLSISKSGIITFAKGQTFPAVTGNETVTGNVSASQLISTVATGTPPLKVTSTTEVANLNPSLLGGYPASSFVKLGVYNDSPFPRVSLGTIRPTQSF